MTTDNDYDPKADNVFGNLNRLNGMVRDFDDRALVLSFAAFAEETLGELLQAFLLPGDSAEKLIDGFNAPLGTFSARIKMAHALGLISQHQFDDLERLRKIRNEFAHSWEPISFSDQRIRDHIRALHFHSLDDVFPDTPRGKIQTTISLLLTELRSSTHQLRKQGRCVKIQGVHLLAGVLGSFDEQVDTCRNRLIEIAEELSTASGDRRRYLLAARHRWHGKLEIVKRNAPMDRRDEVTAIQVELNAWNTGPDY